MQENNHEHGENCKVCNVDFYEEKPSFWKSKGIKIIAIAGLIFLVGLYFEFISKNFIIAQLLFLLTVIISGRETFENALKAVKKKNLNISVLISIAAIGAFLIGHGEEGAAVIYLFYIAEFLESYAAERARKSVASLLKLAPETALLKRGEKTYTVHVHDVKPGEIIIIKPGDRIPLDGVVVKGSSSVDQAPITGESIPVSKTKGNNVFAGTINQYRYLEVRVTKSSGETVLSKIVRIVENAQKKKSKTEKFVDKFAKYYTPVVVFLSLMVMFIPPLFFNMDFQEWFYRGLILLVVSCPCALAISTPVSIVSSLTSAAKNGVLVKGGAYIEEIKNAKVFVFDKTGTLTEGKPEVTDIIVFKGTKKELLEIAYSIELNSKHPLSFPIVEKAKSLGIKKKTVKNFKSITGKGVSGKIGRNTFYVGSKSLFKSVPKEVLKLEEQGKTVIIVGTKESPLGAIALMDKIRDSSFYVIKELKRRGIRTVMLTGDNKRTASYISNKLEIDEFYAELLPQDKVRKVEELLNKYKHVVFVGDGVNDAPALAKAHVGIAMGAIGSDVAIETADIALMKDDLRKIVYLLNLSNKTITVIKQNIAASILIKSSLGVLAFFGTVSLWLAVAVGDVGLSIAVILNALRIGRK